jgi:hypothetical protein
VILAWHPPHDPTGLAGYNVRRSADGPAGHWSRRNVEPVDATTWSEPAPAAPGELLCWPVSAVTAPLTP